jgi:acetyl-CoA acetyltransferase
VAVDQVEDVVMGCTNQAGEDNRNVARMGSLLAGLPVEAAGQTVNRLCGSGLQAIVSAGHAIAAGEGDVFVAGGVESMSRAPYVMLKPERDFARGSPPLEDSVLGWRFVNPAMPGGWKVSLGETAEIVAERHGVSREDQDTFSLDSHVRAAELGFSAMARIVGSAVAGVEPDCMGIGPVPATRKVLERTGLAVDDLDLVELNEAFAAQAVACIRELGLDYEKTNVNGGAIALGHPLSCTGARLMTTLVHEMGRRRARYGLCTMCIGVGQGIATIVERER